MLSSRSEQILLGEKMLPNTESVVTTEVKKQVPTYSFRVSVNKEVSLGRVRNLLVRWARTRRSETKNDLNAECARVTLGDKEITLEGISCDAADTDAQTALTEFLQKYL